jgi:hypothetical protein
MRFHKHKLMEQLQSKTLRISQLSRIILQKLESRELQLSKVTVVIFDRVELTYRHDVVYRRKRFGSWPSDGGSNALEVWPSENVGTSRRKVPALFSMMEKEY